MERKFFGMRGGYDRRTPLFGSISLSFYISMVVTNNSVGALTLGKFFMVTKLRFFDFKEESLTDLGLHDDVFSADAAVQGGSHWLMSEYDLISYDQFIEEVLSQESKSSLPEWFALTTNDELMSIGHYETFDDADEGCTEPVHWIFDESSLRSFQVQIHNALTEDSETA